MVVVCSEKVTRLVGRVIRVQALGFDGYGRVVQVLQLASGIFVAYIHRVGD